MPDPLLTLAIKEAYASAPDDVVIIDTIELRHAAFVAPIRVVCAYENVIARLEAAAPIDGGLDVEFQAYAFRLKKPDIQTDSPSDLQLEIDNVSQEIETQLDAAAASTDKIEVTYRPYLSTQLTQPHMNPPMTFTLKMVEGDDFRVKGIAGFRDVFNRQFPGEEYTWTRFPGLAR